MKNMHIHTAETEQRGGWEGGLCKCMCVPGRQGKVSQAWNFQEEYQAEDTLGAKDGDKENPSRMQKSPDPLTPTFTSQAPASWLSPQNISWELT